MTTATKETLRLVTKETLRVVLISLSTRLGMLIERGLERFEVELGLKAILEQRPHVVLIEDTLRAAYNCAVAVKQRQPNTGGTAVGPSTESVQAAGDGRPFLQRAAPVFSTTSYPIMTCGLILARARRLPLSASFPENQTERR